MKLFSAILFSTILASCANPEWERPWTSGPTYYKVPECVTVEMYPETYRKFNPSSGLYDTYRTFGNTTQVHCNYNPMTTVQETTINSVYLYGTYEE